MQGPLVAAAILLVAVAAAHSILGERYILRRLFRRGGLPRLFGGEWFTKQTLRFAWHITSVAWLGFAAALLVLARYENAEPGPVLKVIAGTFLASSAVAGLASRGKHLSWPIFLAIAILTWLSS